MGGQKNFLESFETIEIQNMLIRLCPEVTTLDNLACGVKYAFLHTETKDLHIGDLFVITKEHGFRVVFYPGAVSINLNTGCITRYGEKAFPFYAEKTRCFIPIDQFRDTLPLLLEESVAV